MSIDVFTFVAQIFNFALLVYLLQRFLYRPVQDAMQRREEAISGRLGEAARERREAESLAAEYRERLATLDHERDAMVAEARAQADRLASDLTTSLKQRMQEHERDWRTTQSRRAREELVAFREGVRVEMSESLRTALAHLADEALEERMMTKFLARVDALTDEQVHQLLPEDDDAPRLEIVTTHPLSDASSRNVESVLRARVGDAPRIIFSVDPSRIAGIELVCKGHRLGWSIADYLESLDEAVRREISKLEAEEPAGAS